jgi:hypothetical protein
VGVSIIVDPLDTVFKWVYTRVMEIMKTKKQKAPKCIYNEDGIFCENSSYNGARGLCNSHYCRLQYHVKKGTKTWEDFEKKGKCARPMTQEEYESDETTHYISQ